MSLLRHKPEIAGVVIADFDTQVRISDPGPDPDPDLGPDPDPDLAHWNEMRYLPEGSGSWSNEGRDRVHPEVCHLSASDRHH